MTTFPPSRSAGFVEGLGNRTSRNAMKTSNRGVVVGNFAVSGVSGGRYQARPDCNQFTLVSGSNGPDSLVRWADSYCSDTCRMSGATAGETALILSAWRNANAIQGAVESRLIASKRTLVPDENLAGRENRSALTNLTLEAEMYESSNRALTRAAVVPVSFTCHPKRSWLCRVAAGFIHALVGRNSRKATNSDGKRPDRQPARPTAPNFRDRRTSLGMITRDSRNDVKSPMNFPHRPWCRTRCSVGLYDWVCLMKQAVWLLVFGTLHAAQGDPARGPIRLHETQRSFLSALSAVESGHNDMAIGPRGEVSRYQIMPSIWRQNSKSVSPRNPESSRIVAERVMMPRVKAFQKTHQRAPSAQEWYLLWHCPARVMRPTQSDLAKASRFSRLLAGQDQPHPH